MGGERRAGAGLVGRGLAEADGSAAPEYAYTTRRCDSTTTAAATHVVWCG